MEAEDPYLSSAEALHDLGLFQGTGTNADGTPIYDLDKTPTRNQALIMLVRLLGKEAEAKAGAWDIPFTDVSEGMKPWATPTPTVSPRATRPRASGAPSAFPAISM